MQKRKAGRKKFHETRHQVYKGVRQRNGKWVCELRQPSNKNARVWLGTFAHPDMAAIAYDVAALAFKGDAASLNFPHSAASLPRLNALTCSVRAIQSAAMQAAEKHFSRAESQLQREEDLEGSGSSFSDPSESSSLEEDNSSESSSDGASVKFCWDEEELFNMPELLNSMAEALIITPPALERGFNWVGGETTMDLTLW